MAGPSIFSKEPGTGLPPNIESIGRDSLDVVQPQLFLIRDHHFSPRSGRWLSNSFEGFIGLPVVAGYILGLVGAVLQFQGTRLSEVDILKSVLDVHNHFLANNLDVEMSVHYMMQQSMFKFGLDIGAV